jgi:uncharacterized membrane protein YfcA
MIIGVFANFLSGLFGIGGGIIIIPALSTLLGMHGLSSDLAMHLSLGTSLAAVPFNALTAALSHRKHQVIEWKLVGMVAPGMLVGTVIGPYISSALSGEMLRWIFGGFLAALGVRYLINPAEKIERYHSPKILLWFISPVVGVLASMLGLGGGVFVMPLLTRLGVSMRQALAVSAFCLVPTSLVGTLGYIREGWGAANLPAYATGFVYWPVVFALVLTGLIMAPIGVKWAHQLSSEKLKRGFGILLLLVAVNMCYAAWSLGGVQ